MTNGNTIDVPDPNTIVGPSSAIMPIETIRDSSGYHVVARWRTVALARIIEFVDIGLPKSHTQKKNT